MNYHGRIMNIPASHGQIGSDADFYRFGHRDARHAAAEIANEADAVIAELLEALELAIQYVPMQVIACNGLKCREPWCESCCGYEEARDAVEKAQKDLANIRAAITKARGES